MKRTDALPTMKDVAREAGVSLGTVSKVMNGIPVGASYRVRVERAAAELGYQINSYARGLKTNKTNTIALIWPSVRHPFFAALVDEITAVLMRRDYRTILMLTNYDPAAEQKCITLVRQNKADGIIALTYNPSLRVDEAIPFVTIDRHCGANVPCVSSDNFSGGQMAAEKLLSLGCRNLLMMRIGSEVLSEVDKRGAGFESVCRARGVHYDAVVLNDEDTMAPFYRYLAAHIRDGVPDFDGIFCNTDSLACHIQDRLLALGIRTPEDVQIIGYDGILDPMGRPYCSTFVQPVAQMAETAVDLLLNPGGSAVPSLICLPVRYMAGGTTREEVRADVQ